MSPLVALLALPSDFAKNPAYAKPITVELAMTPLRKVVEAMAAASGKPLAVGGLVADLKATVLVKGLPVGSTMDALADALGFVWKPEEGGILRLNRPDGNARDEAAYVKEEAARIADLAASGKENPRNVIARPGGRPSRNARRQPDGSVIEVVRTPYVRFDPDLLATEIADAPPLSRLLPPVASGASAFAKSVAAWPAIPPKIDEVWSRPIAPAFPKSEWTSGALSLGDLLAAWHASSGLPVVADAFRIPLKSRSLQPAGGLAALQALASTEDMALKLEGGVVRMRHPAFWRLRLQEIPESSWATIERPGGANLANLASFAAKLTASQAAAFRSQEPPLSRTSTEALQSSYPALVLWSALPTGARTALLAGRPVGLPQISGAANAYAFALREAPYYGSGDPSEVLKMDPAKVGLFGVPSAKSLSLRLAGERGNGVAYALPF